MKTVLSSLYHIRTWPRDLRAVSSILLGATLCLYSISRYFRFSNAIGSSVQMFEAYIIVGSCAPFFLAVFLGSLLLVSDAPFITPLSRYEIVRMGRKNWLVSQGLYIILSCIFYSAIILFFCIIYSFIFCRVSLANSWSTAITMLAEEQPTFAVKNFSISFPNPDYIHTVSPVSAVLLTLLFNSAYSSVLGLCILLFNLLTDQNWGWVFAAVLHIFGYIIYANGGYFIPIKFSLFCCALPAHLFTPELNMSPFYAFIVFVFLGDILSISCKKAIFRSESLN